MANAFTELMIYVSDVLPDFLLAEPIVYFVAAAVALVVLGIILRLIRSKY